MGEKPTYEELEQRVKELEKGAIEGKQAVEELKSERDKLKVLLDGLASANIGVDIVNTDFEVLQWSSWFLPSKYSVSHYDICKGGIFQISNR